MVSAIQHVSQFRLATRMIDCFLMAWRSVSLGNGCVVYIKTIIFERVVFVIFFGILTRIIILFYIKMFSSVLFDL